MTALGTFGSLDCSCALIVATGITKRIAARLSACIQICAFLRAILSVVEPKVLSETPSGGKPSFLFFTDEELPRQRLAREVQFLE